MRWGRVKMKEKIVVIVGPTAVGKTKISVELAKRLNGEIISGDSMQVYKQMDIGTAKIKKEEMNGIPHYLIDILEPTEPFSVAAFQERVQPLITTINQKGKLPFLVGGTGLYVNAVIQNYQFANVPSDPAYRQELETYAEKYGEKALHQMLKTMDEDSYNTIHPNNVRRVIRALEVFHVTKKPIGEYQKEQEVTSPYEFVMVGLSMERTALYDRINKRVDQMIEEGLIDEARRLYAAGIKNCQSVQAIGYKEIYEYIEGKTTKEEAIEKLKQNSRRYAKRQFTWFRNKADVNWFDMTEADISKKVLEIQQFIEGKLNIKSELF